MLEFLSGVTINGIELWVVLLCCCGVFLAAFIDAIGGGGGIISVPTYLMAFSGLPTYYVLGTNKVSSSISTLFSPPASSKAAMWRGSCASPARRWRFWAPRQASGYSTTRRISF